MKTLDLIRYLCLNADKLKIIEFYDRTGELHICTKVTEPLFILASIDPSWYDDFLWHTENKNETLLISPIFKKDNKSSN